MGGLSQSWRRFGVRPLVHNTEVGQVHKIGVIQPQLAQVSALVHDMVSVWREQM